MDTEKKSSRMALGIGLGGLIGAGCATPFFLLTALWQTPLLIAVLLPIVAGAICGGSIVRKIPRGASNDEVLIASVKVGMTHGALWSGVPLGCGWVIAILMMAWASLTSNGDFSVVVVPTASGFTWTAVGAMITGLAGGVAGCLFAALFNWLRREREGSTEEPDDGRDCSANHPDAR